MKAFSFIFSLLIGLSIGFGQNLVQNPSFEDTVAQQLQVFKARHWKSANDGTPDIFTPYNTLFPSRMAPKNFAGYQIARTGKNYAGLLIYSLTSSNAVSFREFLQNKLLEPLESDSTYCFRIYLSLADSSNFASRGIFGVYFSTNPIFQSGYTRIQVEPDLVVSPDAHVSDKNNWLKFDLQYDANGGEQYLTMGNFWNRETIDTLYQGGGQDDFYLNTYYYADDLYLGVCDSTFDFPEPIIKKRYPEPLKVYPNPVNDQLQVYYQGDEDLEFKIYDKIGREIYPLEVIKVYGGHYLLTLVDLPGGMYIVRVKGSGINESVKVLKLGR